MAKIKKWLKKQATAFILSTGNVEKNALNQKGDNLEHDQVHEMRHNQGTLADSLMQGVITAEVERLRWRNYKVLQAADSLKTKIVGYEEDGTPITKTVNVDFRNALSKIKVDTFDDYPVEYIMNNEAIKLSKNEALTKGMSTLDEPTIKKNKDGEITGATHGIISSMEYFTTKQEHPIIIHRESPPKFEIETYTKKLVVRKINDTQRLLEFYVSMYPDEFNRTTRLFISDIKKAIANPRSANFLDIKDVWLVTEKAAGVPDFLEYKYEVKSFDKIVTFNGHYIIKFIATPLINGVNIVEKYRNDELEVKYATKERKSSKK